MKRTLTYTPEASIMMTLVGTAPFPDEPPVGPDSDTAPQKELIAG